MWVRSVEQAKKRNEPEKSGANQSVYVGRFVLLRKEIMSIAANAVRTNAQGQRVTLHKFITVQIDRHADFGGGKINADLPDTEYHRAFYGDKIVKQWGEWIAVD